MVLCKRIGHGFDEVINIARINVETNNNIEDV